MAWENCMIYSGQGTFLKLTSIPSNPTIAALNIYSSDYFRTIDLANAATKTWVDGGTFIDRNMVLYEDANWKLYTTSNQFYLDRNGSHYCQWSGDPFNMSNVSFRNFWACIDRTSQKGIMGFAYAEGSGGYYFGHVKTPGYVSYDSNFYNVIYQFLTSAEIPEYTWQSVPSVSGKNGILNLSQIASASINNGEAVSGASASAFTSLTAQVSTMVTDDSEMSGADAGGISGSGSNSGNQSSGYAFGHGESGTNVSGGGSGYYGGEKGGSLLSGGAGSGYIGNALVSNKKMVGYNVPTSSAEATKTESINEVSANPVSNKPKLGNGFVKIKFLREPGFKIYGFHINGNTSDPSQKVTYLADAIGMTPAHMNFQTGQFDYGDWENAFFMPKPVVIQANTTNYDKVISAYLDPNDYSKDLDGNSVNITSLGKNTNVMMQFPKIWVKVVADENDPYSGSVYISNTKVDDDYFDFAYIDKTGTHRDYTYLAAYMGSVKDSNTIGSVSGAHLTPDNSSWNGANQFTKARNAGNGYDMEMLCQVQLVTYLLILIGKSTNTRSVFGNGIQVGSDTAVDNFITGVHNDKGLFYGSNQNNVAVKVFGIENWWGLAYRRYAGDIINNLVQRVKLCYGTSDGSSTSDYIESSYNGSSYWATGITLSGTDGKVITKLKFITGKGIFPCEASGDSADSDYCDFMTFSSQWKDNTSAHSMHGGQGSTTGALSRYCQQYPQWYWQQFNTSLGLI